MRSMDLTRSTTFIVALQSLDSQTVCTIAGIEAMLAEDGKLLGMYTVNVVWPASTGIRCIVRECDFRRHITSRHDKSSSRKAKSDSPKVI